eukprot:jgi/Tetstr1/451366/TSEL_038402.t1
MKGYGRFFAMIVTSTLVMFGLMYLNTYALDHIFFSETRAYMALLMGATMAIVMLSFMLGMYKNTALNISIYAVAILVFAGSLYLVRSQATVDEVSWMRAMIPHHSIAILTSENANLSDPRVLDLANRIIEAQRSEIDEMKALIADLDARIGAAQAVEAAAALSNAGWTTPEKLRDATWEERVDVLNKNGYARYDESTSRMLGETAEHLIETYDGDLRNLRKEAGQDPARMRTALKTFKGLGDVGVDIFFREVQTAWDELYPFADKKSLDAARELGLPHTAQGLAKHIGKPDYPRLVTSLVRASLDKSIEEIRRAG